MSDWKPPDPLGHLKGVCDVCDMFLKLLETDEIRGANDGAVVALFAMKEGLRFTLQGARLKILEIERLFYLDSR